MDKHRLVYALEDHLDDLDTGIDGAHRRRRRWNWSAAAAVVAIIVAAALDDAFPNQGFDTAAGGLAVILVILLILGQMAGAQADNLTQEREGARLPVLSHDETPDPADLRAVAASLPLRRNLAAVRARLFRSTLAAMVLGGLGLAALTLFGLFAIDHVSGRFAEGADFATIEDRLYEIFAIGMFAAVLLGFAVVRLADAASLRRDRERLEVEVELIAQGGGPDAARARKLFLLNEQNLRKYYAANRFNGAAALGIAVICVLAGLGMTLWTILLVLDAAAEPGRSEALVAGVGAANVVMINVVAAIVLRVHASVSSNVNAFHERLVRTHEAFLSNVIATEINDPDRRDAAFAAIAAVIGRGSGGSTAPRPADPKPG